jgi:hypothetical protein
MPDALTTALPALDHAAVQTDRWLFIALAVISLYAVWHIWKYMTLRLEQSQTRLETMTDQTVDYGKQMARIAESCAIAMKESTAALQQNARVLENNTKALVDCAATMSVNQRSLAEFMANNYGVGPMTGIIKYPPQSVNPSLPRNP